MIHDLLALIGLFLFGFGVWLISIPASLISVGALLIVYSLVYEFKRGKAVENEPS